MHLHFYDPQNAKHRGTTLKLPVSTMQGIEDNIISASKLVKAMRFNLNLRPDPLESNEACSDDWEGFFKLEGEVLHRIPIYYNQEKRMWYLYYGVGATPSDARRDSIDHMRQQQVDSHPDANDDGTQYKEHTDQVSIVSTVGGHRAGDGNGDGRRGRAT
jgi:hypothetical protein